jgi:hypothetical protein
MISSTSQTKPQVKASLVDWIKIEDRVSGLIDKSYVLGSSDKGKKKYEWKVYDLWDTIKRPNHGPGQRR